jgi:hypothetical protein
MSGHYRIGTPRLYRTEDEARKAAQTLANRLQRVVTITWASNEGTQREVIAQIAPNRKPRSRNTGAVVARGHDGRPSVIATFTRTDLE